MKRIDWLEGEDGKLTRVIMSDEKFNAMHLATEEEGKKLYCIELTDEMVDCITQGWES